MRLNRPPQSQQIEKLLGWGSYMRSDSRRGKMVSNVKRRKWIWMDYTSEGGDDTKEVVLTDKCFLFSNELQHDSDVTVNPLCNFLNSVIFLTNHMLRITTLSLCDAWIFK